MCETKLNNSLHYTNRGLDIRLGSIASACLGFLLISVVPWGGSFFTWQLPLAGPYHISFFEGFAIILCFISLPFYGIRIKNYEQFLFLSIMAVIFSRIISLLAAEKVLMEQWISVFRYVEVLVLIYIFANLFTSSRNRHFFIWGLIITVAIETIGGLILYLSAKGAVQGFFISVQSDFLKTLLIIACILKNRRHRFMIYVLSMIMITSIFATLSRGSLILLIIALIFTLTMLHRRKGVSQPFIIRNIMMLSVFSFLLIALGSEFGFDFLVRANQAYDYTEGSIGERLYFWDKAIGAFLENPVTGIGSGGLTRQMFYLPQVFHVEVPAGDEAYRTNLILGVASETGLVGLVAYLLWVMAVIGICLRTLRLAKMHSKDDTYAIAASLLIMVIIMLDSMGDANFGPISTSLIGFLLGWLRESAKIEAIRCSNFPRTGHLTQALFDAAS